MSARMRRLLPLLLLLVACSHPAPRHDEHQQRYHAYHRFEHAEDWVARFEDPSRDAWQKPDEVIRTFSASPSASVADIGAGTGYFSVRLARATARRTYASPWWRDRCSPKPQTSHGGTTTPTVRLCAGVIQARRDDRGQGYWPTWSPRNIPITSHCIDRSRFLSARACGGYPAYPLGAERGGRRHAGTHRARHAPRAGVPVAVDSM